MIFSILLWWNGEMIFPFCCGEWWNHPFWTWWYFIYMLLSSTLSLNVRIILSDHFPNRFYSYIFYVYNHCRRKNQNRRLNMGLTSHPSCVYDDFSSHYVSFLFDYESDNGGYGSGSSSTCPFTFCCVEMVKWSFPFCCGEMVKWYFHFVVVKWWNVLFHFSVVRWWNSLSIMLSVSVA